jgi:hypothetical protein
MATGNRFSGGGSGHVVNFEYAHGGFIAKLKSTTVHSPSFTAFGLTRTFPPRRVIVADTNTRAPLAPLAPLAPHPNDWCRNEDFNDDRKDAGEIGAGHSVTALYEIVPPGVDVAAPPVDPLRYQQPLAPTRGGDDGELATVKVRYKDPDGDSSRLITRVLANRAGPLTPNVGFASAVAEFGLLLKDSAHRGSASFAATLSRARSFRGADTEGYRAEFVHLVDLAAGSNR